MNSNSDYTVPFGVGGLTSHLTFDYVKQNISFADNIRIDQIKSLFVCLSFLLAYSHAFANIKMPFAKHHILSTPF